MRLGLNSIAKNVLKVNKTIIKWLNVENYRSTASTGLVLCQKKWSSGHGVSLMEYAYQ